MSREQQIEVVGLTDVKMNKPTLEEISLIATMLPELFLLVQQLDDSDED